MNVGYENFGGGFSAPTESRDPIEEVDGGSIELQKQLRKESSTGDITAEDTGASTEGRVNTQGGHPVGNIFAEETGVSNESRVDTQVYDHTSVPPSGENVKQRLEATAKLAVANPKQGSTGPNRIESMFPSSGLAAVQDVMLELEKCSRQRSARLRELMSADPDSVRESDKYMGAMVHWEVFPVSITTVVATLSKVNRERVGATSRSESHPVVNFAGPIEIARRNMIAKKSVPSGASRSDIESFSSCLAISIRENRRKICISFGQRLGARKGPVGDMYSVSVLGANAHTSVPGAGIIRDENKIFDPGGLRTEERVAMACCNGDSERSVMEALVRIRCALSSLDAGLPQAASLRTIFSRGYGGRGLP